MTTVREQVQQLWSDGLDLLDDETGGMITEQDLDCPDLWDVDSPEGLDIALYSESEYRPLVKPGGEVNPRFARSNYNWRSDAARWWDERKTMIVGDAWFGDRELTIVRGQA